MSKYGKPDYEKLHDWEFYGSYLMTEYQQSIEEGLDIASYKEVFEAVSKLPKDEIKKRLSDVLADVVAEAKTVEGYPYQEPSELEAIRALRKPYAYAKYPVDPAKIEDQIHGAWVGRICGCLLGKTVEGIRTNELIPFLKETGNYPMHRYIYKSDVTQETLDDLNQVAEDAKKRIEDKFGTTEADAATEKNAATEETVETEETPAPVPAVPEDAPVAGEPING